MKKNIKKDIKTKFLNNFFIKKEGKAILKNIRKKNLVKDGYLDSLDLLELSLRIKKEFKVNIDLSREKVLKSFEKYDNIIKLIK